MPLPLSRRWVILAAPSAAPSPPCRSLESPAIEATKLVVPTASTAFNCRHESGPREQWRLEAAERAITDTYQAMMGLPGGSGSASPAGGAPATPQRLPQQMRPGALSPAQALAAQQAATAAALNHSFRWAACGMPC